MTMTVLAGGPSEAPRRGRGPGMDAPAGMPRPITSFVGRRAEIATVVTLLQRRRVVTLVGPGGIGKSRLAIEVARRSARGSQAAIRYVALARDTSVVIDRSIADALGIPEQPGEPAVAAFTRTLGAAPSVLVLDECESFVEAIGSLLATLLATCPTLRVLATSRRPIGIAGEAVFRVPSLAVGSGSTARELRRSDAVALFVDRARAGRPTFELTETGAAQVAEICRLVSGIPLAIELVAAHTSHFDLPAILERLADQPSLLRNGPRDAPERLRSLEAALDWSLGLLSVRSRRLFSRLGVFRSGFGLEAATALAGPPGAGADAALAELVDHSLVAADGDGRGSMEYRMLEPVRQYAIGRLTRPGRRRVEALHARYVGTVTSRFAASVGTEGEPIWLARLERSHDDLRAALDWALAHDRTLALGMAGDLSMFWLRGGHFSEGRRSLAHAVAIDAPRAAKARCEVGLAFMLEGLFDLEGALRVARAVAEDDDVPAATRARAWEVVGRVIAPDPGPTRAAFEAAVVAARVAGDESVLTEVLGEYSSVAWALGDRTRALEMADVAVRSARRLGNQSLLVIPLSVLAREAMFGGHGDGERLWRECLEASRAGRDVLLEHVCLTFLGLCAAWRSDLAAASARLTEAAAILRRDCSNTGAQLALAEMVGLVLLRAGRSFEGARLILAKERLGGPDWVDSPPWWEYVSSEVERAFGELGDRRDRAREEARAWSLEDTLREADRAMADLGHLSARPRDRTALSDRESELARLVADGLTNREIAARLSISERTAEAHVGHILDKLDLANRAQIGAWTRSQTGAPS